MKVLLATIAAAAWVAGCEEAGRYEWQDHGHGRASIFDTKTGRLRACILTPESRGGSLANAPSPFEWRCGDWYRPY